MFKVGQKLWFVPVHYQSKDKPYEVTVTKVGRKWTTLSNRVRVDSSGKLESDWSQRACCYLSKNEHDLILEKDIAWQKLKAFVQYKTAPDHLQTDEINAIYKKIAKN